jgi:hypothetical protein
MYTAARTGAARRRQHQSSGQACTPLQSCDPSRTGAGRCAATAQGSAPSRPTAPSAADTAGPAPIPQRPAPATTSSHPTPLPPPAACAPQQPCALRRGPGCGRCWGRCRCRRSTAGWAGRASSSCCPPAEPGSRRLRFDGAGGGRREACGWCPGAGGAGRRQPGARWRRRHKAAPGSPRPGLQDRQPLRGAPQRRALQGPGSPRGGHTPGGQGAGRRAGGWAAAPGPGTPPGQSSARTR